MNIRTNITFDQIKKLDAKGNFDLSATLGEFVKLTYNQHPSETLQGGARVRIRGNLRVSLTFAHEHFGADYNIMVVSDHKLDKIRLRWLSPWLGEVASSEKTSSPEIVVALLPFDRQFILPFLAEFKAHLAGQHPLEYLILKYSQLYLSRHSECHSFDAKIAPTLDEKTGNVLLTLRDGKKLAGMGQIANAKHFRWNPQSIFPLLMKLEQCRKHELGGFVKTAVADAKEYFNCKDEKTSEKPVTTQEKNDHSLNWLILAYRALNLNKKPASLIEPFRKEMVNQIINVFLPVMTVEALLEKRKASRLTGNPFDMGESHLYNLLTMGDADIFKSVLDFFKANQLDINNLGDCYDRADIFSSPLLGFLEEDLSLRERGELLKQLFSAGMKWTEENYSVSEGSIWRVKKIAEIQNAERAVRESVALIMPDEKQIPVAEFKALAISDKEKNNALKTDAYFFEQDGLEENFVEVTLGFVEFSDERDYQIQFLKSMLSRYRCTFAPTGLPERTSGTRKAVINQIVSSLLPAIKATDLSRDLFKAALTFPDRTVFNALLRKIREANVDLNDWFYDHPLLWLTFPSDLCSIETMKTLLEETRWTVGRLFDEGVVMTSEAFQKLMKASSQTQAVQVILCEHYLRYKQIVGFVQKFLALDPANMVMRYLVCDDIVNKDVKQQLASQNRYRFHSSVGDSARIDSPNSQATPQATLSPRGFI